MADFPIGVLAKETGVKIPTIRFYEEIGLLPAPIRATNNRRLYATDAVRRLKFIRHARELGFEIEDIRELLALSAHPAEPCADIDRLTRQHLSVIDQRIQQLTALRTELQKTLDTCTGGCVADCRVIESICG